MRQKFNEGKSKRVYDIVTGDESWIYQFDPETKRQSSIWIFPGENPPRKFRRSRSVGKRMVASFFSKTGHVATIQVEDRRTVNAKWYVNRCIPQVLYVWRNKRPRTGLRELLWHHDNAHTAALTIDFLSENSIQLMTHQPYSPDWHLVTSFSFQQWKKKIRGTRFDSADDAVCGPIVMICVLSYETLCGSQWRVFWETVKIWTWCHLRFLNISIILEWPSRRNFGTFIQRGDEMLYWAINGIFGQCYELIFKFGPLQCKKSVIKIFKILFNIRQGNEKFRHPSRKSVRLNEILQVFTEKNIFYCNYFQGSIIIARVLRFCSGWYSLEIRKYQDIFLFYNCFSIPW